MNIPQRIVLIVGAIALIVMLCSIGSYQHGDGGEMLKADRNALLMNIWDWRTAIVRATVISLATAALYFAVGKGKK